MFQTLKKEYDYFKSFFFFCTIRNQNAHAHLPAGEIGKSQN